MRSYANLFAPQRPELTAAWESAVHNQKRAEAAEAKLVQIERAIPDTFYAGADPAHRIEQLVRIWQNAVKANAELEAEGAQLCEQFLAENRDALEQEARAKKAEAEVERLRAEQALQRAKLKEEVERCRSPQIWD